MHPSNKIVQAQFLLKKSTFPQPFQWIYYIAKFVHWCKKKSTEDQNEEPVDLLTKSNYLRLLKKLITIKQQKELEKTREDNLADLREDLKQDMKLEIQKILDDKFEQLAKLIAKK